MRISWKKAESFINTLAAINVSYELSGYVGAFTDVDAEVERISSGVLSYISRTKDINKAILYLKLALGEASRESGCHAILTRIAVIEKEAAELRAFVSAKRAVLVRDTSTLKQMQASIAASDGADKLRTVAVGMVTEGVGIIADNRVAELRRELTNLKDELLEKTAAMYIRITEDIMEILVAEGVV